MPRFAANISLMYQDKPFIERFAKAKQDGFQAVECQFPYPEFTGASLQDIRRELDHQALEMVLHNLWPGRWSEGDRGLAAMPGRQAEFKDHLGRTIEYAQALGVPRLNCLAGLMQDGQPSAVQDEVLIDNLTWAAKELQTAGLSLMVEAINTYDMPGFYLHHSQQAIEILMQVASNNISFQYDAYHMHRMGEDILEIEAIMPLIGHIQIADHPGRHEPGTGEIPYAAFFDLLDDLDYSGWVGCEYTILERANFFS